MLIPALGVIRDVEGVVAGSELLVIAPLHHKGVGLAPDHIDLWDEETIDVPGDAPAHVPGDGGVAVVAPSGTNLGEENPILESVLSRIVIVKYLVFRTYL